MIGAKEVLLVVVGVGLVLAALAANRWWRGWVEAKEKRKAQQAVALSDIATAMETLREQLVASSADSRVVIGDLAAQIAALHTTLEEGKLIAKYMSGLAAVCEKYVEQVASFDSSVRKLTGVIAAPIPAPVAADSGDEAREFSQEDADHTYLKQTFMAEGRTEGEADALARVEAEKKTYSLNAGYLWP